MEIPRLRRELTFFGGALNGLANRFGYSFFPSRIRTLMLPHVERSQHVTPHLVYSRWATRGHHRQVDHARSSHYLLDDCTRNHRFHHRRRCYSYVCASTRPAFSSRRSYFLHFGCDPGAVSLLQTQDSISAHVESRRSILGVNEQTDFFRQQIRLSRLLCKILTSALCSGAPWHSMSVPEDFLDQRDAREIIFDAQDSVPVRRDFRQPVG